jgi:succinate dehydrogenase / fumarate reductase, cytochrome b subunit
MNLLTNTVGRKILMAVTGLLLIAFVTVHLIGNLSVFAGPDSINAYAKALHDLGPLVWLFRLGMVALFAIHITFGIQLYFENKAATPDPYAIEKTLVTSFSAKTMIFTGLIILAFLLYHLLHFTVQVTNPSISAVNLPLDAASRLDVYRMMVLSFQKVFISLIYIVAMIALLLHLSHGISSWVQTFGLSTGPSQDKVISIGKILAIVYGLAYIAIPLLILARIVK